MTSLDSFMLMIMDLIIFYAVVNKVRRSLLRCRSGVGRCRCASDICEDTIGCKILSLRAFLVGLHY